MPRRQKRMLQKLPARPSLPRIPLEASPQKVLRLRAQARRHRRNLILVPNLKHRHERVRQMTPRRFPRRHLQHRAPQRPDVRRQSLLVLSHHLRCHPQRRPVQSPQRPPAPVPAHPPLRAHPLRRPKIRQLHAPVPHQNVLPLDVAVHDPLPVQVIHPLHNTPRVRPNQMLVQRLAPRARKLPNKVRQAPLRHVLQVRVAHQLPALLRPIAPQTPHHEFRLQALQNLNLVLQRLQRHLRPCVPAALLHAHRLHGEHLPVLPVHRQVHLPKCSRTNQVAANPRPRHCTAASHGTCHCCAIQSPHNLHNSPSQLCKAVRSTLRRHAFNLIRNPNTQRL
uniref:Uncharacterized protein n=1 Tax=Physcomitrium patens TaxID=3218 RepID=A0A2K1L8U6_PHYPA|nr:hypothetical protein PHYPA_000861 [Physcomitrium patens]